MRKIILSCLLLLTAFHVHAQRCAVLEFKAGAGISQADVEGISAIFNTYFQPVGYTMVERTQIDKVIDEQGFQRSNITQYQMVRLGVILNVSKVVVGDVTIAMGQYNVDVRVVDVETGTESAKDGATFTSGSSYRSTMQKLAQKLAAQIAITPAEPVYSSQTSTSTQPKKRDSVEILYGYLKIYPNELGVFQAEPTTIIAQINSQAQYGYNNWRIPTNEELSLLRANNYLGGGEYMTKEKRNGIVLLVSDGDDYATVQAKEQERVAAETQRSQRGGVISQLYEDYEYVKMSDEALMRKDTLAAIDYLTIGLDTHPNSASILLSLVNLYLITNEDPIIILETLYEAKKAMPDNPSLYYVEGNIYTGIKDYEKALAAYDKGIAIDPNYDMSYYGKANVALKKGEDIVEQMNALDVREWKKYDELTAKVIEIYKGAIEPFEKCYDVSTNPDVKAAAADFLKRLNFQLRGVDPKFQADYEKWSKIVDRIH